MSFESRYVRFFVVFFACLQQARGFVGRSNGCCPGWWVLPSTVRSHHKTHGTRKGLQQVASSSSPNNSRQDAVASLLDWAKSLASIQIYSDGVDLTSTETAGLGFLAKQDMASGQMLIQVPVGIALTVEAPGDGPNDSGKLERLCRGSKNFVLKDLPWYIQFSLYLHSLRTKPEAIGEKNLDRGPWLDSLPSSFDTPIHWTENQRQQWLQYDAMLRSVTRQETLWKSQFDQIAISGLFPSLSWEIFLWGCETARSRAFSGSTAGPFNPGIFAFTLLLVVIYIGFGLGTLEEAANGAGVVFSATVLNSFVVPKLFKKKKYVVCPMIDMANHNSVSFGAQVSLEYFANAYSMVTTKSVTEGKPIEISYGDRSNDQLLQYYGFVESDNPSDVYIMPPLREWPLEAMEKASGRQVAEGRLEKLDRAGLLGSTVAGTELSDTNSDDIDSNSDNNNNPWGGVVVNRVDGIDPAVVQALRALFSTDLEWKEAGQAVGNFAALVSEDNERAALLAAKKAVDLELKSKPTTLEQDLDLLAKLETGQPSNGTEVSGYREILAIRFRIEKKKLLTETLDNFRI